MTIVRNLLLWPMLALAASLLFSTAASAHEDHARRHCECADRERHHHHHHHHHRHLHHQAMRSDEHRTHDAMGDERFEHQRFAGDESGGRRVFRRFHRGMHGAHERFDGAGDGHRRHHFAMRDEGEGCHAKMQWRHRMMGRAWGEGEDREPGMARSEWREHRHHHVHHDGEWRRHDQGVDPYRDGADSRRGAQWRDDPDDDQSADDNDDDDGNDNDGDQR